MVQAPPQLHARLIARRRIMNLLASASAKDARPIISITAPAGYGKTTLAAMWVRSRSGADAPLCIWITLNAEDDRTGALLRRLFSALRPAAPALDDVFVAARSMPDPAAALPVLLERLRALSRRVLLTLDDVHLLASPEALGVVQALIDACLPTLQILLISRDASALRLPPDALHIGADDLRFDHQEFKAYVDQTRLADLPSDMLKNIEQRAEGWITALQLFSIAPFQDADPSLLSPSNARKDFLLEYLDQIVLKSQPAHIQHLLLHTAVAPWIDAELAAALIDQPIEECRTLLETAVRRSLFLQPYESTSEASADGATTYRFHPLFREFLLRQFEIRHGKAQLHAQLARAADMLAARGEIDAAIDMHLHADDPQRAVEIVRRHSMPALLAQNIAGLRSWLDRLSPAQIRSNVELALNAAWYGQVVGGSARAEMLEHAREALRTLPHSEDDATALIILESLTAYFSGRIEDASRLRSEAFSRPEPASGLIAGYRHSAQAYVPENPSDWNERLSALAAAAADFRRVGFTYGDVAASAIQAAFQRRFLDTPAALLTLGRLMQYIDSLKQSFTTDAMDARVAYAETLYWIDDVEQAEANFRAVVASPFDTPDATYSRHKASVYLSLCALADPESPRPPFDAERDRAAWQRAVQLCSPGSIADLAYLRVIRDGLRNDYAACADTLNIAGFDLAAPSELGRMAVIYARILRSEVTAEVETALRALHERTDVPSSQLAHLRTGALLAVLLETGRRHEEAQAMLLRIQPMIERSRMVRIILDHPLLLTALGRIPQPLMQKLALRMNPRHAPFGLSPMQMQVLRLSAQGRRIREIAAECNILPNTVGKHLVTAYRKLGVDNRTDALRVLRTIGILE